MDPKADYFSLDLTNLESFLAPPVILSALERAHAMEQQLETKSGAGSDHLGWLELPARMSNEVEEITAAAARLAARTETIVVIGIGGSYLGARAVIEALRPAWFEPRRVLFAGYHLSSEYLHALLDLLDGRDFGLVMISKSGTTTEPAVTFRYLRKELEARMGVPSANERIIAITDEHSGALRTLADERGYTSFVVPDDVGGRFSVLSPVGLVPIACAGIAIDELLAGAAQAKEDLAARRVDPAVTYAAVRNELYKAGKKIEILASFDPRLHYFVEWWKQLFGESEGKEGKGVFPTGCDLTTDLHSLGQLIQEGERNLFETFLFIDEEPHAESLAVPRFDANLDGLNYLCDDQRTLAEINAAAYEGTAAAHTDGGVPNITITLRELNARTLGYLIFFFEKACAISGYLLGVNPFNQPGVEAYKQNMFELLGKPK